MRYYRDLQPGETLQAGDERFRGGNDWAAVGAELFGLTPNDVPWGLFRRPVDLPVLQPVTPEAVSELEQREAWVILFRHREAQWNRYARATYVPLGRCWFGSDGNKIDPLEFCWFIVPDAIPEVQQ